MTKTPLKPTPSPSIATLGLTHGYRFEEDNATLNAEVVLHDFSLAATQEWALQLWACSKAENASPEHGEKVAEVAFGFPFGENTSCAQLQGSSSALLPAGSGQQTILLALVSGQNGDFGTLHDYAIYPQQETFLQPVLGAEINYSLLDGSLQLSIDSITNQRPEDNLSGTLALELWSLDAPYTGGNWRGRPVASLVLGSLSGQCHWADCVYSVSAALPEESGYLTLMLREWTAAGYITRDYRTLTQPETKASQKKNKAPAKARSKAPSKVTEKSSLPNTPVQATVAPSSVSVNKASEAELVAVKGLGAAVARAIIAARPFVSLDDLCRAKGMGVKLLAKIKDQLAL